LAELREVPLEPAQDVLPAPRRLFPPPLRGMRAAFVFLSRVPGGGFPYRGRDWHWAPAHFPLVGIAVGAASAAAFQLCAALSLGRWLGATLAVAVSIVLTGAFHEDGLADSADGLGGAHGGKSALDIMKDSRIGTYGAVALGLSLMLRVAAIAELAPGAWFAVVYVHCLARIGPVWLLATEAYVSDPANAKAQGLFKTSGLHVATALGWGTACATLGIYLGLLSVTSALAVVLVLTLLTQLCARYFRKAVGGITGDLLGATEQGSEMTAWITLIAAANSPAF